MEAFKKIGSSESHLSKHIYKQVALLICNTAFALLSALICCPLFISVSGKPFWPASHTARRTSSQHLHLFLLKLSKKEALWCRSRGLWLSFTLEKAYRTCFLPGISKHQHRSCFWLLGANIPPPIEKMMGLKGRRRWGPPESLSKR